MSIIGLRVKEARKKTGLTQVQLADKSGISRSYLAGVEQGYYNPSVKTLLMLASVMNTDLNFLTGMTEKQVDPQ